MNGFLTGGFDLTSVSDAETQAKQSFNMLSACFSLFVHIGYVIGHTHFFIRNHFIRNLHVEGRNI